MISEIRKHDDITKKKSNASYNMRNQMFRQVVNKCPGQTSLVG